jgi:hypothetical protein
MKLEIERLESRVCELDSKGDWTNLEGQILWKPKMLLPSEECP